MKADLRERWIEALNSGEYKQGKKGLRLANGSYCCLGVLCDISGLGEWDEGTSYWDYTVPGVGASAGMPHHNVLRVLGLDGEVAAILANSNDNGSTFAEIAAEIEARVWTE